MGRDGRPYYVIPAVAQEIKAQTIVLTAHGCSGINYVLLGGSDERILRHALCPLLTVRNR